MTALIIADDELVWHNLPTIKADILICCGDLPDDVIQRAAATCGSQHILAVKGSDDSTANFPAPIINLHLQTFVFRGVTFGGFGGAWKYKPKGNHLFDQAEVEAALADFPRVDVFVAHNSPRFVHDRDDEVHNGFVAFANYINQHQPPFFLHGHQHIKQETLVGATRVIGTYGFQWLAIPE